MDPHTILSNKMGSFKGSDKTGIVGPMRSGSGGDDRSEKGTSRPSTTTRMFDFMSPRRQSISDKELARNQVTSFALPPSGKDNAIIPVLSPSASFDPIDRPIGGGITYKAGNSSSKSYIRRRQPSSSIGAHNSSAHSLSQQSSPDKSITHQSFGGESGGSYAVGVGYPTDGSGSVDKSLFQTPRGPYPIRRQFIIGCSANSDHDTMEAAFEAGMDAFMPKPFTLQTFAETYERLLQDPSAEPESDSVRRVSK